MKAGRKEVEDGQEQTVMIDLAAVVPFGFGGFFFFFFVMMIRLRCFAETINGPAYC